MHTNTRILTLFAGAIVLLLAPEPLLASTVCTPWGVMSDEKPKWLILGIGEAIIPDMALAWTEDGRFGTTISFPLVVHAATLCVGPESRPWLRTSLYAIGSVQFERVKGEPWATRALGGAQLMLGPKPVPNEGGVVGFGEVGTAAGHRSGPWWGAGLGLGDALAMVAVGYRQYGAGDEVLHEARFDVQVPIPVGYYF